MSVLPRIKYLVRRAREAYKNEGFLPMFRRIRQYCQIHGNFRVLVGKGKNYDFVTDKVAAGKVIALREPQKNDEIRINWVIPDFAIGAGGHMTIFRIIAELEKMGVFNRIYIYGPLIHRNTVSQFKTAIGKHFLPLKAEIKIDVNEMDACHALIATSWETAYAVSGLCSQKTQGFYFVQDFEPAFFAQGSDYLFAEQTYKLGLQGITAGLWLAALLQKNYRMSAGHFHLAADKAVYKRAARHLPHDPNASHDESPFKICFYARPVTPRRCFDLGVQAFKLLKESYPSNFEIHFFGADTGFYNVPFEYHNHGILDHAQLNKLYGRMDLGVVFSATNHSIVHREMMATGLPVLDLDLPSTRTIFANNREIILAEPVAQKIAELIQSLRVDRTHLDRIADHGFSSARNFSWQKSGEIVLDIIKNRLSTTRK